VDDYIESIENISVEDDSDQPDLQLSLTSNEEMDRFRDLIAEQMWNDYQEHIRKE
jgi:type IV secretory pathway component VirB8